MGVPVWTPEATGLSQSGDTAWVQDRRVGGKSVERSCLSMSSTTPRPAVTLSPLVETCRALPCVVVDFPAPSQGVMGSPLLLPWCQQATPLHLSVCGPALPTRLTCSCCLPTVQVGSWEFCSGGISSRAISAVMGWLVGPWWAEPMVAPAASDSDHWKSTASTWPLGALLPECLHPPRAGRWHCWRGWVLLQTGPLSAVIPFCSWFRGSEAGTGYKQPLSRWLAPQRAPPPSRRLREQLSTGDRWLSCSAIGQGHRGPLPPLLCLKGASLWTEGRPFFEKRVCHLLSLLVFPVKSLLCVWTTRLPFCWPLLWRAKWTWAR